MKRTTLEEASEFITDGTHGSPKRTEDANGIPLLSAKNVFDGEVRWEHFDRVPRSELDEFQKRVHLKKGDVLMTCVGSIGRAAVWLNERPVVFFRSVAIIRPKLLLLPEYLEYIIRSAGFQQELRRRTKQASQGGIYLKDIKGIPIGVPPLAEQERIIKLLDEADELRKLRSQADRRTAALIPALFHEMFGDVDRNSKHWPVVRFVDIGDARLGKMLDAKQQTGKHKRPYLRNANVQWDSLALTDLLEMDFSEAEQLEFRLRYGDLLICEGGEVGRAAIWRDELPKCYFQKALHRVRVHPSKATPEFLLHLLRACAAADGFRDLIGTATIPHLTGIKLASFRIPLPPLPLQKVFAQRASEIREMEAGQALSGRRLKDLFHSMLHRAFEGSCDVLDGHTLNS